MAAERGLRGMRSTVPLFSPQWWMLTAASLTTFLVMFDSTAAMMTLSDVRAEFAADFTAQQWVVVAHALPLAALLLPAGALSDRFGRRGTFCAGVLLFTFGAVAAGAAGTLFALIAARGLQGAGAAVLLAVASALAAREPGAGRSKALGTAATLGLALGPVVGGVLAQVDWRLTFVAVLPIGTLLLAIGTVRLSDVRPPVVPPVDWSGVILFGAFLSLVVVGLLRGEALGWTSTPVLAMSAGAALSLVVLLLVQRARGDKAMVELALFGNHAFLGLSLSALLAGAIGLAVVFLEVLHLRNALEYSPLKTALHLLPFTSALVVTGIVSRRIPTRLSPGGVVGTSILLITTGTGLIAFAGSSSTWAALVPGTTLLGIGLGADTSLRRTYSVRTAEPARAGAVARITEMSHYLGVVLGIAAFGALFQYRVARAVDGNAASDLVRGASTTSLNFVAMVCVIVGAVGALVAFTCIRRRDLHEFPTAR